jgi:hypothetical protein
MTKITTPTTTMRLATTPIETPTATLELLLLFDPLLLRLIVSCVVAGSRFRNGEEFDSGREDEDDEFGDVVGDTEGREENRLETGAVEDDVDTVEGDGGNVGDVDADGDGDDDDEGGDTKEKSKTSTMSETPPVLFCPPPKNILFGVDVAASC